MWGWVLTFSMVLGNCFAERPLLRFIFCFSRSCFEYTYALRRRAAAWPC